MISLTHSCFLCYIWTNWNRGCSLGSRAKRQGWGSAKLTDESPSLVPGYIPSNSDVKFIPCPPHSDVGYVPRPSLIPAGAHLDCLYGFIFREKVVVKHPPSSTFFPFLHILLVILTHPPAIWDYPPHYNPSRGPCNQKTGTSLPPEPWDELFSLWSFQSRVFRSSHKNKLG